MREQLREEVVVELTNEEPEVEESEETSTESDKKTIDISNMFRPKK